MQPLLSLYLDAAVGDGPQLEGEDAAAVLGAEVGRAGRRALVSGAAHRDVDLVQGLRPAPAPPRDLLAPDADGDVAGLGTRRDDVLQGQLPLGQEVGAAEVTRESVIGHGHHPAGVGVGGQPLEAGDICTQQVKLLTPARDQGPSPVELSQQQLLAVHVSRAAADLSTAEPRSGRQSTWKPAATRQVPCVSVSIWRGRPKPNLLKEDIDSMSSNIINLLYLFTKYGTALARKQETNTMIKMNP